MHNQGPLASGGLSTRCYLDHAATSPVDPRVVAEMAPLWAEALNASSVHGRGQRARRLVEGCRERIAAALGLDEPDQVIFTSGATESANLALRGSTGRGTRTFAYSQIEHACIHSTVEQLARQGRASLAPLRVLECGRTEVPQGLDADVLCLMHSNNETGVVQDLEAARTVARRGTTWICDATQALGKHPLQLGVLGADLVILGAHKCGGPAGVGILAGTAVPQVAAQATGGVQELGLRAGTEPVALIAGLARAVELANEECSDRMAHLMRLEQCLLSEMTRLRLPYQVNGLPPRVAGILNVSIAGIAAADLVIALDQCGFEVSPGSACSTGVVSVSRVLSAMFPRDPGRAGGGVRISFGLSTTEDEVVRFCRTLSGLLPAAPSESAHERSSREP